jgi:hypothetical protein
MASDPFVHTVHRSINRPLTIWGLDRRFFFLALVIGSATFNFFGSLLAGVIMFVALYTSGHWATGNDPQILRILLNSAKCRHRYDPGKFVAARVRRRAAHD